jgi:hypothetical protein
MMQSVLERGLECCQWEKVDHVQNCEAKKLILVPNESLWTLIHDLLNWLCALLSNRQPNIPTIIPKIKTWEHRIYQAKLSHLINDKSDMNNKCWQCFKTTICLKESLAYLPLRIRWMNDDITNVKKNCWWKWLFFKPSMFSQCFHFELNLFNFKFDVV